MSYIVYKCKAGYPKLGLGDRIVGIVTAIVIANKMQRKFAIMWNHPLVGGILEVPPEYDYHQIRPKIKIGANIVALNHIDVVNRTIGRFAPSNLRTIFKDGVNVEFICNINLCQDLFSSKEEYIREMVSVYQELYIKYLVPHPLLQAKLDKFLGNFKGEGEEKVISIGIQLRFGDKHLGFSRYVGIRFQDTDKLMKNLKDTVDNIASERENKGKKIKLYVTSDYPGLRSHINRWFPSNEFDCLYQPEHTSHLAKMNNDSKAIEKIIFDNIVLTTMDYLIISNHSNFGRIAAIMNPNICSPSTNGKARNLFRIMNNQNLAIHPVDVSVLLAK